MALFVQPEPKKLPMMQGILVDDFLVKDDTTGGAWQGDLSIVMSGAGNFVVVWEDERNGGNNVDIYLQQYNFSGVKWGNNQKVNDEEGIARQVYPAVAVDDSGDFVIAWVDYRNGANIYSQRYNSSGIRQGSNQKTNDDEAQVSSIAKFSVIAMDGSGNFVIAWVDERNSVYNPDIYFQQHNSSGVKQGNNQKANDDAGSGWRG